MDYHLIIIATPSLNYGRQASLDEETATRIINKERSSSAARGMQERIWADFIDLSPEDVQSPLEGKAIEHPPEGEQTMPSVPFDAKTASRLSHEYFSTVKPREFLEDIRKWSPGLVEHLGWEDLYDEKTGKVAGWFPDEWKKDEKQKSSN